MARVSGVDIPDDKRIIYALTYIYGVGLSRARQIVKQVRIEPSVQVKDLDGNDLSRLSRFIENNYRAEGELRMQIRDNIRRLQAIGTYRGSRHKKKLPARGQRTRHNARTVKQRKRVTVGGLSAKKKAARSKT
ncbi:30S ribosomal protein S13 [Patescibacteria group bacterium]|nr:30S ribosomal protein S13 [Patescibacteria group bacterium]MBU1868684.1 30S ribosomal protein S13 [Patescibacteria group bacterium]